MPRISKYPGIKDKIKGFKASGMTKEEARSACRGVYPNIAPCTLSHYLCLEYPEKIKESRSLEKKRRLEFIKKRSHLDRKELFKICEEEFGVTISAFNRYYTQLFPERIRRNIKKGTKTKTKTRNCIMSGCNNTFETPVDKHGRSLHHRCPKCQENIKDPDHDLYKYARVTSYTCEF